MGQGLVLGGQRRRGDLGDHEAGVDATVVDQKRRQTGHPRADQQRHPPLGQRPDLGDGQGQVVGGEGHGFCVEVAAGEDVFILGKHQRVVGDRVGLAHQHLGGLADLGQAGPHHLRLAAQ